MLARSCVHDARKLTGSRATEQMGFAERKEVKFSGNKVRDEATRDEEERFADVIPAARREGKM